MPSQITVVDSEDQSLNIVCSKLPPPDYPNVSFSEYISERISSHPEDAFAFVSFVLLFILRLCLIISYLSRLTQTIIIR